MISNFNRSIHKTQLIFRQWTHSILKFRSSTMRTCQHIVLYLIPTLSSKTSAPDFNRLMTSRPLTWTGSLSTIQCSKMDTIGTSDILTEALSTPQMNKMLQSSWTHSQCHPAKISTLTLQVWYQQIRPARTSLKRNLFKDLVNKTII